MFPHAFGGQAAGNCRHRVPLSVNGMPDQTIPSFLERTFRVHDRRIVDIDRLYVGVRPPEGGAARYQPVNATPHYKFARHVLTGAPVESACGYDSYAQYASLHIHQGTEEQFVQLIEGVRTNGYDVENKPILVYRLWRRPWPPTRWDVADGFHRAAVLAALGQQRVTVVTLRQKKRLHRRLMDRIKKAFHGRDATT